MKPLAVKILAVVGLAAALSGCAVYEQPGYYPAPTYGYYGYAPAPPMVIYESHPHWHGGGGYGGGGWGHHWR